MKQKTTLFYKERICGSRKFSNLWWASILSLGSWSFLYVGISTFFNFQGLRFLNSTQIVFFPQGLVMGFYGLIGLLLSFYLWFVISWNIGEGYNEFDKETGYLKIFRWGFPGKNRRILLIYPLAAI